MCPSLGLGQVQSLYCTFDFVSFVLFCKGGVGSTGVVKVIKGWNDESYVSLFLFCTGLLCTGLLCTGLLCTGLLCTVYRC